MAASSSSARKLRTYTEGPYAIVRGPYGYMHGLEWGIWRDGRLLDTARTLKAARRTARRMAQVQS